MSYWKFGNRYAGVTSRGKRFVVNSLGAARSRISQTARKVTKRTQKTKRRTIRRMAKKRSRRRSFFSTQSIFKYLRVGALIAPAIYTYSAAGGGGQGVRRAFESYAGIDHNGQFNWSILARSWLPFVATGLVTHGVSKLNGIIRRL